MGAEDMLVQLTERNLLLGEASCAVYQPQSFPDIYAENRGDAGRH
jgi:hypothetical protein